MGFLAGKRVLITGLLSNRSIAYGIATAMQREGAVLAFTYQGEGVKDRVLKLASEFGSDIVLPCDVANDDEIAKLFADLGARWDGLDGIVHSIAFAPREALAGAYLDGLTRDAFRVAHEVSSYSFAALAKAALPMMQGRKAALLTLTYLGAVRAVPNYNVMGLAKASLEANVRFLAADLGPQGVRVNAISAGPIKTLSAPRASASTAFQRGRSRRLRPPASAASARSSSSWRKTRRCAATSRPKKSATWRPS